LRVTRPLLLVRFDFEADVGVLADFAVAAGFVAFLVIVVVLGSKPYAIDIAPKIPRRLNHRISVDDLILSPQRLRVHRTSNRGKRPYGSSRRGCGWCHWVPR
jgi:hypothetical protein